MGLYDQVIVILIIIINIITTTTMVTRLSIGLFKRQWLCYGSRIFIIIIIIEFLLLIIVFNNNMIMIQKAMALQWIKDNIHSFKGDGDQVGDWEWQNNNHYNDLDYPSYHHQITLFGESAGAGAWNHHDNHHHVVHHDNHSDYHYHMITVIRIILIIITRSPCLVNPPVLAHHDNHSHSNYHDHDDHRHRNYPDYHNHQITLFGESAGAGAVSVHLVSPISRSSSTSKLFFLSVIIIYQSWQLSQRDISDLINDKL